MLMFISLWYNIAIVSIILLRTNVCVFVLIITVIITIIIPLLLLMLLLLLLYALA